MNTWSAEYAMDGYLNSDIEESERYLNILITYPYDLKVISDVVNASRRGITINTNQQGLLPTE